VAVHEEATHLSFTSRNAQNRVSGICCTHVRVRVLVGCDQRANHSQPCLCPRAGRSPLQGASQVFVSRLVTQIIAQDDCAMI